MPGSRTWGDLPRVATLVRFTDLVTDAAFGVVDTHWGSSPLEVERSAALILDWLEPGLPWIVLGDLNATVADPALRALLEGGLGDALGGLPAAGPGVATHHTFDGAVDGTRIDHVLVTREWTVRDARIVQERVGGRLPSDHWPVVADLELTSGRAATDGEEAGP